MFEIRVLPVDELGPGGERLGAITIGDFTERFACYGPVENLENLWLIELQKLINGAFSIALAYDPRFSWVVYREDQNCFIQQVLSVLGDFSEHLAQHITETEDGDLISEWSISVRELIQFVETHPNNRADRHNYPN